MVKLQKHKAYTYKSETGKNIEHYKYLVNVPESALNELGWTEGQELNMSINQNSLTLKPQGSKKETNKK